METSILLVDRETFLIEPLKREFGSQRLLLRIAASVHDAQRLIDEFPPDVVIIDADMPDAVEFITRLRALDDPIITVCLTDSPARQTQLQALGMESIILKREGPQPVLDTVREYVDPDAPPPPRSDKTEVLVVDDEQEFLTMFSKMLSLWGYMPLTAANGENAIKLVEQHPGIAAVLLDLRLPGRGGMEVLREIHKLNPRTGVIILSGLADREIAKQAIKLGAFDYVTKPPDFTTLQSTLLACLSHAEYQSQSWWKRLMG